jgi:hypothetical protein
MKESTQTANTFVRGARRVLPHFDWRASPEVTPAGDVGPDRAGRPEVLGVNHVGLAARDPARLAEFYRDVVGLEIVGGDPSPRAAKRATSSIPPRPSVHVLPLLSQKLT